MELTKLFNQNQVGNYITNEDWHLFNNANPRQLSNLMQVNKLYTQYLTNQCGLTDDDDLLGALYCLLQPILYCPSIDILWFQPVIPPIDDLISIHNYFIQCTGPDIKQFAYQLQDASDFSFKIFTNPLNLDKTLWHLIIYCFG